MTEFKVTTYEGLYPGDIFVAFVAVIEGPKIAAHCIKTGDEMFAVLGPFMPKSSDPECVISEEESENIPTLHPPTILDDMVINLAGVCQIVPDVAPSSLIKDASARPGNIVLTQDGTLLAVRYKTSVHYVDINSGKVLKRILGSAPLILSHWHIETRVDHDWTRLVDLSR